ncbi:DUF4153 domain-containing protein [Cellulomonas citrea]|uniref:DUF4153 domain-containing protein n=1 Tax=Cellulomonas citrea TaxID=1909423 RepID=UPI00135B5054|nr:DUF4173 domain-containing protein [Cellulomonas citrea]
MTSTPPVPEPAAAAAAPSWAPPRAPQPDRLTLAARTFWQGYRAPVPASVLAGAGVTGLLGAVVLTSRPGLGLVLLTIAGWAAAAPVLVHRRRWADLALAVGAVALVAVVAVRDSPPVLVTALLVAVVAALVAATGARSPLAVLASPLTGAATAVRTLPWMTRGLVGRAHSSVRALVGAAAAVAVAVGLALVFGALFASADPVFARLLPHLDLADAPARIVLGLLAAGAAAALAHLVTTPPPGARFHRPPARTARLHEWLLPVLTLDALVWAFVLVQVSGLLGGSAQLLARAGLSYAEYARQGFGQLLLATALTLLVVAVAARRAPRATATHRLWTTVGLGLLCLGTLGVVAFALRRMGLYVDAFGLTRLRVMATWAELVLGAGLLLVIAAGVRWRAGWLPRALVGTLVVAALGLAVWNPDAQIVRHNATATALDGLDLPYLAELSADAVPAARDLPEPDRSRLLTSLPHEAPDGWAAWNLSRAQAAADS